jgi:hypothetical protein
VLGTDAGQVIHLTRASSVEWNLWWLTGRNEIGEARMRSVVGAEMEREKRGEGW